MMGLAGRLASLYSALGTCSNSLSLRIFLTLATSCSMERLGFAASASFVFYDALLPHVARPDEVDRVSSAGYALGYLGGAILLTANLAWILKPAWFGLPDGTLPTRLAFASVAVWWALSNCSSAWARRLLA